MRDRSTSDPSPLQRLDPVDAQLESVVAGSSRPLTHRALSRRLGLQWSATSIPVALLLLLGVGFGPHGASLLSPSVLEFLDPAMPVALAALGTLIGLAVGVRVRGDLRWAAAAGVKAFVTVSAVAVGTVAAVNAASLAVGVPSWTLGLLAGVCAAASLGVPSGNPPGPDAQGARVTELEAAIVIAAGGLLLATLRERSFVDALSLAGQACAVALVLAAAGWLLLTQASSDTEQRVITLATLMLVGGVSDYLSLSPMLGGLATGILWRLAGGPARDWMRRDAQYVLHPLLVTLLLVAGARAELSTASLGLAAAYALLRCSGTVAGGLLVRRIARRPPLSDVRQPLLGPGVIGVGLALNTFRAVGPDMSLLVTVVVIGTIASELLAGSLDGQGATE